MKLFITIISIVLLTAGCDEMLPQRSDPSDFFVSSIRMNSFANEGGQSYAEIYLTVVNKYEESVQGYPVIDGTISIDLEPDSVTNLNYHRTLQFSENNISFARKFNKITHQLTIDPGDSVVFYITWDLKNDEHLWMMRDSKFKQSENCYVYNSDGSGIVPREISFPQNIIVSASVKLYQKVAYSHSNQFVFSLCFMVNHRGEYEPCQTIKGVNPCSLLKN